MILARFNGRYDNFGDILIFKNLYSELVKYDKVYLLGGAVPGIDAKALRFRQALYVAFRERVLSGARVLLVDPPGARFTPRTPRNLGLIQKIRRNAVFLIWNILGVKFYVAGISIDSVVNKKKYQHYEKIGVRDSNSQLKLHDAGLAASFCPDMACLVLPRLPDWSRQDVLVSLRKESPDNDYASEYSQDLEHGLPIVIDALNRVDTEFAFYAQVLEDQNYNRELALRLGSHTSCKYLEGFPKLSDYRETFQKYKFVVSNRLHVLLPAMSEGAVPIALISRNHSKIVNLMTSYGFEANIIFVDKVESIEEQVVTLLARSDDLRKKNYEKLLELNSQARNYIKGMVG